jgi:hypothetical protein
MKNGIWYGLILCTIVLAACDRKRNEDTSQIPAGDTVNGRGELQEGKIINFREYMDTSKQDKKLLHTS